MPRWFHPWRAAMAQEIAYSWSRRRLCVAMFYLSSAARAGPVRCVQPGNCISAWSYQNQNHGQALEPKRNLFCAVYRLEHLAVVWIVHLICGAEFQAGMEATGMCTSALPKAPSACIRKTGGAAAARGLRAGEPSAGGGFPMRVSFSHDGSISERASRSQDD